MLKTTSQQLIDSLGYEKDRVGRPIKVGAALAQDKSARTMFVVPEGMTFMITHIAIQNDGKTIQNTPIPSPTATQVYSGITLLDADGTAQTSIDFRGFARYDSVFDPAGGTPDWRAAAGGNLVTWKLKYPIPVSAGWTVQQAQNEYEWGNQSAVYGVVIGEDSARQLGARVRGSATDSERRFGVVSTAGAASATDVIAARAGQSIRIMDVQVRMQPDTNTDCTLTLQQTDGTKVFKITNDNPAEQLQMAFSPDWFLKAGQALQVISDVTNVASVNMTYEFVDEDEVPGDFWFSVVEPDKTTPGGSFVGTGPILNNFIGQSSTVAVPYYPRSGAVGTASPGKGSQHMVRGYTANIQKTATALATDDTEQTKLTISTGSTGGQIAFAGSALSQTNFQIAPVISAVSHDQCVYGSVDGVNIPCKKDDGSIWVDVIGFNSVLSTPSSADADVRDWAVCLWGRTTAATFTDPANQGA